MAAVNWAQMASIATVMPAMAATAETTGVFLAVLQLQQ
jgi:hypothetical protein